MYGWAFGGGGRERKGSYYNQLLVGAVEKALFVRFTLGRIDQALTIGLFGFSKISCLDQVHAYQLPHYPGTGEDTCS
jgi:hypothetical protein